MTTLPSQSVAGCIQPPVPPQGQTVWLYSDGACDTTKGHGGWATILRYGDRELELSGHESGTTNNRMELMGLIAGLRALKRPCTVLVVTDSQYLRKAFTDRWILNWQQNGWKTASKEPVKNQDLWEELIELARKHALHFVWVRGHSGHAYNERVDKLAVQERLKLRK
ncbi:ribonuclease HI [Deinobacterium chartae]|uniref:Ribonuclease H n=1 Tax=Deinobacterium chartae TaxID=521158 RepID=A0A841HYZ4_9DEIO|nr:ribonuclease HI [Deinobacterium chartae]